MFHIRFFRKCSMFCWSIPLHDTCNKLTWTNNIEVYTKDDLPQNDLKLRSGVNNIVNLLLHNVINCVRPFFDIVK